MTLPLVVAQEVILSTASPEAVDRLRTGTELVVTRAAAWSNRSIGDARGVLVTGKTAVGVRELASAPRLGVVSVRAVGYDCVDVPACTERGVVVCNTPGVLDAAVAEMTVLLMLTVARRLPDNLAAARWQWSSGGLLPPLGVDLHGKTLGVVGFGRIGSRVAQIAVNGFGMRALRELRLDRPSTRSSESAESVPRERLFAEADFVTVHLPLTDTTRGYVGRAELALMKPTAFLVNTARGGVVDEPALVDALAAGTIAGAALDVTAVEPYPADGRLWELPNVVVTPHIGSGTIETRRAMSDLAIDNLLSCLNGVPPAAVLNHPRPSTANPRNPR